MYVCGWGSFEVEWEESGFLLLPALEALATHIWQLFCINSPVVSLGQAQKGAELRGMWVGVWGGREAIGSNDLTGM